ncbi:MAG: class I SAM-dependent methyltransferase [Parcubacteria group bacterium]
MAEGFLNPQQILSELNLSKSMVAADFGAGSGGWSIPLAQILSEGKVFSLDILEGPLSALVGKAKLAKIINIQTQVADVEKDTKILPDSCDLILMTNLLFQCENKKAALEEGKRILKKGGKILLVDWKKSANFGPRDRAMTLEDIKKIVQESGFTIEREFEASPYHYGLILVR